jgi:AmmeMemoRadiSam system protein B
LARLVNESEELRGRRLLLVASTDLSHFYHQSVANVLDQEILRQVAALSPEGVLRAEEEGRGYACGHGALAAVLWAAQALGANRAQVLKYATSGDVTGDYDRVVGYGAAAILRSSRN